MSNATLQGKHILLIDDDVDLCAVLKDKLASEGFVVSIAHTGGEGESIALAKHPDVILLDVLLPDKTGHDVLDVLRGDEWGKNANITLLTNVGDLGSISNAVGKGSTDYLVKTDWSLSEVVEHIKEKLHAEEE